MSDNTRINPGTGGDNIATEDMGAYKIPVVKIRTGALDVDGGDVTAANPLATQLSQGNALLSAFNPIPTQLSLGNNPLTALNPIPTQLSQGNALLSALNPIPTQLSLGNVAVGATNPLPTQLSQGNALIGATNPIPTQLSQGNAVLSALNPIPVQLSQGNVVISNSNPIPTKITDGTNAVLTGSAANLIAFSSVNSFLTSRPGNWSVSAQATAGAPSASRSAGGTGVRHVCNSVSIVVATDGYVQTPVIVNLRNGATGVGAILQTWAISAPANSTSVIAISNLNIVGSVATAMTLEFAAATTTLVVASVNLSGYDTQ